MPIQYAHLVKRIEATSADVMRLRTRLSLEAQAEHAETGEPIYGVATILDTAERLVTADTMAELWADVDRAMREPSPERMDHELVPVAEALAATVTATLRVLTREVVTANRTQQLRQTATLAWCGTANAILEGTVRP